MSDSFVNPIFGERERPEPETAVVADAAVEVEVEGTGHADVDAVIGSLSSLDDLPVAEHVAVFERAHESLRRTLVRAGQDGPGTDRS